ncbi:hypothetical protein F2S72_08945 [Pseudomonas syringae pv. actinidiae]|nr:hypothetical protein [Pseudomonas syringae pv. actinidiae]
MNQAAVSAWIETLKPGDTVGVFTGSRLDFRSKVVRKTASGMIVCKPGGTFKASGYPHGRLADQARVIRPAPESLADQNFEGRNPDGFGFVDVCGEAWKGHINLFWKDFPLALVPPPLATEIRAALILARQAGDRTAATGVAEFAEALTAPPLTATSARARPRPQSIPTPAPAVLVANKGSNDELRITPQSDGRYTIDNVQGERGRKWLEFPRTCKSAAACKATASRILCEPQVWETVE